MSGWLNWIAVALGLAAIAVAWVAARRRRYYSEFLERHGNLTMALTGPPVTPEMQQLFGPFGHGEVTGIVQVRSGLSVAYDNGVQLTFTPVIEPR